MDFHQLQLAKHCRVCGKRLCKAKSKAPTFKCTDHQSILFQCFGVDVSQDDPMTHPLKFATPAMLPPSDIPKHWLTGSTICHCTNGVVITPR